MGRPKKNLPDEPNNPPADLETHRRIVNAAEKLFLTKGFKGVSMKELAEEVKVTPAALYYHFPKGKTDLFVAVVRAMFDESAAGIPAAIADGGTFRVKLKLLTTYLLNQRTEHMPMLMRDVNEHLTDEADKKSIWTHYAATYVQALTQVFQQASDSGEITLHVPPYTLAAMFQGMTIALMRDPRLAASRSDEIEIERLATMVVSVLVDGIGLRQPSPVGD